MTRRRYPKSCEWCGRDWDASKPSCRTCSPKCRAQLRETEKPTKGSGPREYPAEIIELVTSLYQGGMTVQEVAKVAPKGYKVQLILERHLPKRRPLGKRDQWGERNHMWKGHNAGYEAAHWRVKEIHGPARQHACIDCGGAARDWSYDGLDPEEIQAPENGCWYSLKTEHYSPRCVKCHRGYDKRQRELRAEGGGAHV